MLDLRNRQNNQQAYRTVLRMSIAAVVLTAIALQVAGLGLLTVKGIALLAILFLGLNSISLVVLSTVAFASFERSARNVIVRVASILGLLVALYICTVEFARSSWDHPIMAQHLAGPLIGAVVAVFHLRWRRKSKDSGA